MGREYTVSTGMKIFYILLAVGMFIFAIVLLKIPQSQSVLLLFPLIIITGSVLIIVNALKRKVIVYNDSILCINLFSRKEMAFNDVKGCRIGQKSLTLESNSGDKLTIGNYSDLGDSSGLESWIKGNFKDLDAIDLKQNEESFLHDTALGYSEGDRKRKLKIAKQVAIAYNVVGPVGSFGFLFLAGDFSAIIFSLIFPPLAIVIMFYSKGLIKFLGNSKRSVTPYIMIGFMMPSLILLFNFVDGYQIFEFNNLWVLIIIAIAVVFGLIYFTGINKSIGSRSGQIVFMMFMSALYGFGSIININCAFDKSAPTIYKAEVLSHRIESGKHTSYLLTLTEWGPMHREREEDVGRHLYNKVANGDTVKIYFKPGLLKAPWYRVGQ